MSTTWDPRRSIVFWTVLVASWSAVALLPMIPIYKGGDEPAFYFPLGYLYLGFLQEPIDSLPLMIVSLPLIVGHLAAALAIRAGVSFLVHFARRRRTD